MRRKKTSMEEDSEKIRKYTVQRALILVFALSFIFGMVLGKISHSNKDNITKSEDIEVAVTYENDNSDEAVSTEKKEQSDNFENGDTSNDEQTKLNEFKEYFVKDIKDKYPETELSFAVKNLDTGVELIHNNKKMNSASVIKLFILETVYSHMAEGTYKLSEEREEDLELMITESKNDASTNFIDDFGGENEKRKVDETNKINQRIKSRGYKHTELNRKMHDKLPPEGASGYQNYTCVEDVCDFLEGVYRKTLLKEPYNTQTLELLKNQKRRNKIPALIDSKYPDVIVANKTGELSQVENDVALIMCDDFNLIFAVMINDIPYKKDGSTDYDLKEEVQASISEAGLKLVEMYKEGNL